MSHGTRGKAKPLERSEEYWLLVGEICLSHIPPKRHKEFIEWVEGNEQLSKRYFISPATRHHLIKEFLNNKSTNEINQIVKDTL